MEIMELVKRLKQTCSIVIMISHNMDEVASYCNRIAVLSEGSLCGVYEPRELFKRVDDLEKYKIEMPQVTALACALKEKGLVLDTSVLTEEELVSQIVKAVKGRESL